MAAAKILVVEDEEDIRQGIRILLESEDYEVAEASDGFQALDRLDEATDLVILDVMMPGISGITTCQEIRKKSYVPILFLSARTQEKDKTIGLLSGGDDYLTKPFSYAELIARVKALLRRYRLYRGKEGAAEEKLDSYLQRGEFRINTIRNELYIGERQVELTEIEYKILLLLMKYPGRVYSTQDIYEYVWNEPYFYISNGTVMVHIRKLRVKVEETPQEPQHIKTVWGRGYRFE
jgi:Response regulators consisting of a CheY-like receiver domain and a winged-helix DNA-binding domain